MTRKELALFTLDALRKVIPEPKTELVYTDPYQLIVAVILSAQCTDERVNRVTPPLFEAFPTIRHLASAAPEDVLPYIRSVSYPNNKARHLVGMAAKVVDEHQGNIPSSLEDLQKLPGVGRKTANVVVSVAFDVAAIAVDTHVFRVANRIGLTRNAPTPLKVEMQLQRIIPESEWDEAHHLLILHGRYTCTARQPRCEECPLRPVCAYYARLQRLPPPVTGLDARKGRYFCRSCGSYFSEAAEQPDRSGVAQIVCPRCLSMDVFIARTGATARRVRDYRIG